ncbi:hypothetical protein [Floridanema aerugineum]|uniref:Uncharacterized protein n=1 Tax=Floridaenema aerugineum BLCC-F46 TaxID=3153654 RepID=A0ABV4X7X6_9CYAN
MNTKTWILSISLLLAISSALLCSIKPSQAGGWSRTAARGGSFYVSGEARDNEDRANFGAILFGIGITGGIIKGLLNHK